MHKFVVKKLYNGSPWTHKHLIHELAAMHRNYDVRPVEQTGL